MHRFIYIYLFFFLSIILIGCEDNKTSISVKEKPKEKNPTYVIQEKFASAISSVAPSVVTILSKSGKSKMPIIFRFNDEIPPADNESLGSGFVIKKDNKYIYIATNYHVIEKAKIITVKFNNGYTSKAKIVGKDQKSDIALLKVEIREKIKNINPLPIGNPSELKIGYFVISCGSPYNLGFTCTLGIVSALNRNLGISAYENYIQTDAAINPGDSGGPLINIDGKVVGMNTAIIQTGQGLSFATPINAVLEIANQLLKYGRVKRGWIGVLVQDLPVKIKKQLGIRYGVQVIKVFKDSPAYKAGLKTGDIILTIKGKKILSPSELKYIVSQLKPGEIVRIEFLRGKKQRAAEIFVKEVVDKK